MYLKQKKQRGSALVIAIFIIVVMLALVLSLSRLLISSSESVVYEVQGTRAFFAAQSGLELALTELFPVNASGSCTKERNYDFSAVAELNGCNVTVRCETVSNALPDGGKLFQLSSTANCSAGNFVTSRTVQIEVRE